MLKSNNLYLGDCLDLLAKIEDQTIDLVFLDPPYNLQLNKFLTRPTIPLSMVSIRIGTNLIVTRVMMILPFLI